MQQIDANTKMKHPNKVLPTIFSKYYVNTRRVCFPIESFVSMASIYEFMTKFCVVWAKLMKLFSEQPLLTSPIWYEQYTKTSSKCNTESFGPVCQLWSVTHECMRDSKPQRFVLQHKSLKVTQIATNRGKHIHEAWKKVFAHNLFLISCL